MNIASKEQLKTLANASQEAYVAVLRGASPEDAVVKVARDRKFTEPWVGTMCELTNRALAADHIENAPPEKRASDHPIVHTDAVVARLFPARPQEQGAKAASLAEPTPGEVFRAGDGMAKAASAVVAAPEPFFGSNYDDCLHRLHKYKQKMARAQEFYHDDLVQIEQDVKRASAKAASALLASGIPLADAEERSLHFFGCDAKQAFDLIEPYMPKSARLQGEPRIFTTNPWDMSPWREVDEAVLQMRKSALDYGQVSVVHKIAMAAHDEIVSGLKEAVEGHRKQAGFAGTMAADIGADVGLLKYYNKDKDKDKPGTPDSVVTAGMGPEDVQGLQSISARQSLAAAMNDEVIKRSPMAKQMEVFNRIAEVSPRAALKADTLVPMMRQALEGDKSTFALKQQQDIEGGLAQAQDPMTAK
jgi:hypothetical protein